MSCSDDEKTRETQTWHTDAGELPAAVDAGAKVLAGVGVALVDVHLTSGSGVSLRSGE